MKYFIDFITKKDIYEKHITSLYFDNFKDYIFNLAILKKNKFYKIYDHGVSYGWNEKDLTESIESLMKNDK